MKNARPCVWLKTFAMVEKCSFIEPKEPGTFGTKVQQYIEKVDSTSEEYCETGVENGWRNSFEHLFQKSNNIGLEVKRIMRDLENG